MVLFLLNFFWFGTLLIKSIFKLAELFKVSHKIVSVNWLTHLKVSFVLWTFTVWETSFLTDAQWWFLLYTLRQFTFWMTVLYWLLTALPLFLKHYKLLPEFSHPLNFDHLTTFLQRGIPQMLVPQILPLNWCPPTDFIGTKAIWPNQFCALQGSPDHAETSKRVALGTLETIATAGNSKHTAHLPWLCHLHWAGSCFSY